MRGCCSERYGPRCVCVTFAFCFGSVSFDSLEVINMKKQKIIEFSLRY